ncbi:MAG: nitrate reductase NapAB chaperone NapD [Myxococcota bacterium]|jgi:nitrate reductase NapAB chaperone NapD
MPVLSAVLTLTGSNDRRQAILSALSAEPRITLGDVHGHRLPVVLESRDRDEDKALWCWTAGLSGVLAAELVFADFSDLQEPRDLQEPCDAESTP